MTKLPNSFHIICCDVCHRMANVIRLFFTLYCFFKRSTNNTNNKNFNDQAWLTPQPYVKSTELS